VPNKAERDEEPTFVQIRDTGRGGVFTRRVRRVKDSYTVDARKIRERALKNLEELAEEAHRRATSKYLPTAERQKWARIEAYVYQTLNGLLKTHDEEEFGERLEELYKVVDRLTKEVGEPGEEG
jgi:hypothetical protein